METNPWIALSHIAWHLNMPDEVAKSTTRAKLILLLCLDIFRTTSEKAEDEIRQTYPPGKQYLARHATKEGRKDSNTFTRRRDGVCSWQIAKRFPLFLINNCIAKDQKSQNKRNSAFLIIKFQFSIPPR